MGCIYQIKNLVNGKLYIGKTVGYKQRKYDHFKLLKAKKHHAFHLQNAYNKYGVNSFEMSIIEDNLGHDILSQKEVYYINLYNTLNQEFGYNSQEPTGNAISKYKSSDTKQRIRESVTKNHASKAKPVYLLNLNTGELILYDKRRAISKELVGNRDRNYILGYTVLPDDFTLDQYKLAYTKYNNYLENQFPIIAYIRVYNDTEEHIFTSYHKVAMFLYKQASGIPQVRKCIETGIKAKGYFISLQ